MSEYISVQEAINFLEKKNKDGAIMEVASSYGEPGYDSEGKMILIGSWNNLENEDLDFLEENFELEWFDEWIVQPNTMKAYRKNADCYHWKPSYYEDHAGDVYTIEDMDRDTIIDVFGIKIDAPEKIVAMPFDVDLNDLGFRLVNNQPYERGFHHGQDDDPKNLIQALFGIDDNKNKIYVIVFENSQFYVTFNIWETIGDDYE